MNQISGGSRGASRARWLCQRQAQLLARNAMLRHQLGDELASFQAPLAVVDRGIDALCWLRSHREPILLGAAVIALLKPRRAWRWLGRGWGLWRLLNRLWPMMQTTLRGDPQGQSERKGKSAS